MTPARPVERSPVPQAAGYSRTPTVARTEGHAEGGAPRLDKATLTDSRWLVTRWEGCGEASILGVSPGSGADREYVPPGEASDPDRARAVSARRSASAVRRYCTLHRLDRLWTLTFATEPDSWEEAWPMVERFRRRLEDSLGQRLPMVIVPEEGERNGRRHFHVALGQYVPKAVVAAAWGCGFVDGRRMAKRRKEGGRSLARRVASYVAGYISKEKATGFGKRCYSVTKGMQPVRSSHRFVHLADAFGLVLGGMSQSVNVWSSADCPDWDGPVVYLILDG